MDDEEKVPETSENAIQKSFQKLLERSEGSETAAWTLFRENYAQREQLREAGVKLSDLQSTVESLNGKLPAEGAVSLTPEEARVWQEAVKGLEKPDQLLSSLEELQRLKDLVATRDREDVLRKVAEAAGVKFSVLRDLDKSQGGLVYEIIPAVSDESPKVVVKSAEGDSEFAEFAAQNWADYLPALAVSPSKTPSVSFNFPKQSAGNTGSGPNLVEAFIATQRSTAESKPNPLRREK